MIVSLWSSQNGNPDGYINPDTLTESKVWPGHRITHVSTKSKQLSVMVSANILLGMDRFLNEADFGNFLDVFRWNLRIVLVTERWDWKEDLSLYPWAFSFPMGSSSCQRLTVETSKIDADDYGHDYGMTVNIHYTKHAPNWDEPPVPHKWRSIRS